MVTHCLSRKGTKFFTTFVDDVLTNNFRHELNGVLSLSLTTFLFTISLVHT